jgi:hypothetical protein
MSIPGSLAALKNGTTTGFVGYPQRYELGEGQSKSFIHGVDQAGQPFMLELRIPERFIEEAKKKTDVSIPEVAALAETHRRARNPCYADEGNGPENPLGGAFLAEQVELVDASKNHYAAKWLSILREDESAPLHKIGFGYLEINGKQATTPEAEEMKLRLIDLNAAYAEAMKENPEAESIMGISVLEFAQERDQLAMALYELQQQWFIGVDVQLALIETMDMESELNAKQQVVNSINRNSVNGMYGGVILRPVKVEGGLRTVVVDSVRQINHQYDYRARCIPTVDALWQTFIQKGGSGWLKAMRSKGYEVDIIPCQRVNCGKVSNEKYSKEMRKGFSKQLKAFVDTRFHHAPYVNFATQNAYLACPIAMRNAETRKSDFNGNILLSSIHAFGKAVGNVLEMDKNGERTLKLSEIPIPKVKSASRRTLESPNYG